MGGFGGGWEKKRRKGEKRVRAREGERKRGEKKRAGGG